MYHSNLGSKLACSQAVLTFNVHRFYLKAAKANENLEKTAKYLAVLTLMGHQMLSYWPSTVAAGLVTIASIATDQDASCHLVTKVGIHSLAFNS